MKNEKAINLLLKIEAIHEELYKVVDNSLVNYFFAFDQSVWEFLESTEGIKFKKRFVRTMVIKKISHDRDDHQLDLLVLKFDSIEKAGKVFEMTGVISAFLKDHFSTTIKTLKMKDVPKAITFVFKT